MQGCAWTGRHHLVPRSELALRPPVRPGHHGHGVGGVRTASGLEDKLVHARERPKDEVEVVDDLHGALQRVGMLQGMSLRDFGTIDRVLRHAAVVFHGAGAEEADPHHPQNLLAQVQEVALHLEFRHLRQFRPVRPAHLPRH